MSGIEGLKDLLSASKHDTKRKLQLNEGERKALLLLVTLVLLAVALAMLAVTTAKSSTGLPGCKAIILSAPRSSCLAALANRTANSSICALIQPQQGSYRCISLIAQRKNNVSMCSLINQSNGEYSNCVTVISYSEGNIGYCRMLGGGNESACAYSIARQRMFASISDCSAIQNSTMRSMCTSIYYNNLALSSRNASYCSMLSNSSDGTVLSAILSDSNVGSALPSSTLLPYLYFNMTPINFCYYELANMLKTKSLCAYTGSVLSGVCYAENFTASTPAPNSKGINYTNSVNASALCSSVPDYAKGLCTYSFIIERAVAGRNVSACYAINDTSYQDSCILSIANKYGNASYCNYITNNYTSQLACRESAGALAGNAVG